MQIAEYPLHKNVTDEIEVLANTEIGATARIKVGDIRSKAASIKPFEMPAGSYVKRYEFGIDKGMYKILSFKDQQDAHINMGVFCNKGFFNLTIQLAENNLGLFLSGSSVPKQNLIAHKEAFDRIREIERSFYLVLDNSGTASLYYHFQGALNQTSMFTIGYLDTNAEVQFNENSKDEFYYTSEAGQVLSINTPTLPKVYDFTDVLLESYPNEGIGVLIDVIFGFTNNSEEEKLIGGIDIVNIEQEGTSDSHVLFDLNVPVVEDPDYGVYIIEKLSYQLPVLRTGTEIENVHPKLILRRKTNEHVETTWNGLGFVEISIRHFSNNEKDFFQDTTNGRRVVGAVYQNLATDSQLFNGMDFNTLYRKISEKIQPEIDQSIRSLAEIRYVNIRLTNITLQGNVTLVTNKSTPLVFDLATIMDDSLSSFHVLGIYEFGLVAPNEFTPRIDVTIGKFYMDSINYRTKLVVEIVNKSTKNIGPSIPKIEMMVAMLCSKRNILDEIFMPNLTIPVLGLDVEIPIG